MNVAVFIVALVAMVVLHEAGHFIAAKATGMRVERFSLFFGRALWSLRRGETEYRIGWAPLGGYVKISGMSQEEELPPEVAPRAFWRQPTWKRIVVVAAGPAVNIALGIALFFAFFLTGLPASTPDIAQVLPGTPAASAGVKAGDRLVAVGNTSLERDGLEAMREGLVSKPDQTVQLTLQREGRTITLPATLADHDGVGSLGVRFEASRDSEEPGPALKDAFTTAWWQTRTAGQGFARLFTDSQAHRELTTVVGIAGTYNEVAGLGIALYFMGALSLLLGLFNLLPLLPLDGGHILFAVLEKLRGRNFSTRTYNVAMLAGLSIMVVGMAFGLINDAGRLRSGSFLG